MNIGILLTFIAIAIFIIMFCIGSIVQQKRINKNSKMNDDKLNFKEIGNKNDIKSQKERIKALSQNMSKYKKDNHIDMIFRTSKNPWGISKETFQFIRFGGLTLSIILAILALIILDFRYSLFILAIGILCVWYPSYYYKAIGEEREAEWGKMYEFIWVIKHNLMLYDPAKSFLNTRDYIKSHAPHNKEIIQGFDDFYNYWNDKNIDPYIERYYPFSIAREIYQIIFNMSQTGEFPEDQLNALRIFVINTQNLKVEQSLSSVSGKATVFSLPFLMISVIIGLMVPLIVQVLDFL